MSRAIEENSDPWGPQDPGRKAHISNEVRGKESEAGDKTGTLVLRDSNKSVKCIDSTTTDYTIPAEGLAQSLG